ncbi:MAG: lysophospholipid acyltransferase family protein [Planctomycetota bacterium]
MRLIYRFTQFLMVLLFRLYFRLRVHGRGRVPKTGAVILASNHASHLDPMLVGAPVPRPSYYLARRTLFRPKWWGAILKAYGAIPLERDGSAMSAIRTALGLLDEAKCVVIFPEGTRSTDGELREFKGGVGLLARKTKAAVVPVAILGSADALKRGSPIPRPVKITLHYGEPIRIADGESEEEFLARLREQIEILRALGRKGSVSSNATRVAAA